MCRRWRDLCREPSKRLRAIRLAYKDAAIPRPLPAVLHLVGLPQDRSQIPPGVTALTLDYSQYVVSAADAAHLSCVARLQSCKEPSLASLLPSLRALRGLYIDTMTLTARSCPACRSSRRWK